MQVADDELITKKLSDRSETDTDAVSRDGAADIMEKLVSRPVDIAPSSVSNRHTNVGAREYSSSVDSDTGHMQYAVDNWLSAEKHCSNDMHVVETVGSEHSRDLSAAAGELFAMDEDASHPHAKSETFSSIPTVSIDTPESGDFCFVTEQDISDAQSAATGVQLQKLRDGFHWQKQLVFRSKLTMHTAFERKDNKEPAAVTALAVSR